MIQQPHFADRLLTAIDEKGSPVCVGLDPDLQKLPDAFRADDPMQQLALVGSWCEQILEIVAPYVPAVKPQIARFECLHGTEPFMGLSVYASVVRRAKEMGMLVIGDAKRGDIGSTASAYAQAHLTGEHAVDSLTVNGYFGADGLGSFVDICRREGRGLFVLVRTSNPSGADIQNFEGADGTFYQHMARQVDTLGSGEGLVGDCGFSCVGAVVGATCPAEARMLRQLMPRQIFLLPGYGAQGATAEDCAAGFRPDGTGAIVNASRSVIYAHLDDRYSGEGWKKAVESAAKNFAEDIASAVGAG